MRNPTLHLLGITTSPSVDDSSIVVRSVFNTTRAEEELRHWLETRLDALGIDPVAYSRCILSLLRCPNSALTPPDNIVGKGVTRRMRGRYQLSAQQEERDQKRAVIQCLTSAAEHAYGVEALVDELCQRLDKLTKIGDEDLEPIVIKKTNLESLSPQDKAQRYFKAFPALKQPSNFNKSMKSTDSATSTESIEIEPTNLEISADVNDSAKTVKVNDISKYIEDSDYNKTVPIKNKFDKNTKNGNEVNTDYLCENINNNNNTTVNNCVNSFTLDLTSNAKQPLEIIKEIKSDSLSLEKENSFGFVKSIEMQRENDQELYRQRLAQLEAKFDRKLKALWHTGTENSSDRDIWTAPNLSMPKNSAWPTDASLSNNKIPRANAIIPHVGNNLIKNISPFFPWEIDWASPEIPYQAALVGNQYNNNIPWSNSVGDNSWRWQSIGQNVSASNQSPQHACNFVQMAPSKNVLVGCNSKDLRQKKVTSLPEPEEDLLTSARTHFRPIKDDGNWADGTTFPINNNVERVAYRRSESGNVLYLPGSDSPYMEYRPKLNPFPMVSTTLTPKFRVRQCDKCVQTEPTWSPVKRRLFPEQDRRISNIKQVYNDNNVWKSTTDDKKLHMVEQDYSNETSSSQNQYGMNQPNDRKRRHSSSFRHSTFRQLRPLTL